MISTIGAMTNSISSQPLWCASSGVSAVMSAW